MLVGELEMDDGEKWWLVFGVAERNAWRWRLVAGTCRPAGAVPVHETSP